MKLADEILKRGLIEAGGPGSGPQGGQGSFHSLGQAHKNLTDQGYQHNVSTDSEGQAVDRTHPSATTHYYSRHDATDSQGNSVDSSHPMARNVTSSYAQVSANRNGFHVSTDVPHSRYHDM